MRPQRDPFENFDRNFNRAFGVVAVLSVLSALVFMAAVVVGIILAWKHWG